MTGGEVAVAYPDRATWSKLCWHHPTAKDPFACRELARALAQAIRKGNRANEDPEEWKAQRLDVESGLANSRSAGTRPDARTLAPAHKHVAQSW